MEVTKKFTFVWIKGRLNGILHKKAGIAIPLQLFGSGEVTYLQLDTGTPTSYLYDHYFSRITRLPDFCSLKTAVIYAENAASFQTCGMGGNAFGRVVFPYHVASAVRRLPSCFRHKSRCAKTCARVTGCDGSAMGCSIALPSTGASGARVERSGLLCPEVWHVFKLAGRVGMRG